MNEILKKMMKPVALLLAMTTGLAACQNEVEELPEAFTFGNDLAFIIENDSEINIDFEKSSSKLKETYDQLYSALKDVDMSNVAIGSTSTVNMLSEIGFLPKAAPESKSLKPEIAEKLSLDGETVEGGIINIGSPLNPNIEVLARNGIEMILISDALPQTTWEEPLTDLGIKIQRLNQSEYSDMFVILQVFKDIEYLDDDVINEKMLAMKKDLEAITALQTNNNETKKVAVLQMMGEVSFVNGGESVLGKVVKILSLENVFGTVSNSEMNVEELILKDPEYIIAYGEALTKEQLIQTFEDKFLANESALSDLQAIKNRNYIFLGDETFRFMGSIDFNVTKVMRQVVEGIYGEN